MQFRFGDFLLDDDRFRLERQGRAVPLRPKVFDLLVALVRERDRVVLRDELVARLWSSTRVGSGSLSGLVNELRAALDEDGRGPSSVRTVHARGYQFVAEIEIVPPDGAPARRDPDDAAREASASAGSRKGAELGTGIDARAWVEARAAVRREGARALAISLSGRRQRAAWLRRAADEADRFGFAVRWAVDTDGREGSELAAADSVDEGGTGSTSQAPPIVLALEIEDPSSWTEAGGLVRLLDLLGRSPVLVVAAFGASDSSGRAELALDDPRIVAIEAPLARDREALPEARGTEPRAGAQDLVATLGQLARSEGEAFLVALRAIGFAPVANGGREPARALRRVEPTRRTRAERRDAEAG